MRQIIKKTIRANLVNAFSLEGDKKLFDKIVADQEQHAGPLRPGKIWDLEIGGHDGKQYFLSQKTGEPIVPAAYSDEKYEEKYSSLQKMLEPLIGSTGLQQINSEVIEKYYSYLKGIDHLDILSSYFEPNGEMKSQADGLMITDFGSMIDINLISSYVDPLADRCDILEVGGGYGRLAEVFLNIYGEGAIKYVLLDVVPASLMYAYLYLSRNFPNLRVGFYYNEDPFDMDQFDCYIMPAWHFEGPAHAESFDCCINIQSMQEMNQHHIDYYLGLFNQILKGGSGIAYISNEKDYIFQGAWNYPKNWKLLLKTRTPRSWTRNSPTEVFLKSAGSFERENRFMDFMYSLQLNEFDRDMDQLKIIAGLQQQLHQSQQQLHQSQQQLHQSQQQLSSLRQELHQSQQQTSSLQLDLQKGRQEISSLQLNLQKSQQEVTSLNSTLSRMPLVSGELTIERIDETIGILTEYYRSKELPDIVLLFGSISKIHARLVAANLCLRHGRYRRALVHLARVGTMDPLALFSIQTFRIVANGLIYRLRRSPGR